MAKYGDSVVLVQKSSDGKVVTRLNAIVLRSAVQPEGAENFSPKEAEVKRVLKGPQGKPLVGGEYLDLTFAPPLEGGQLPAATRLDLIMRASTTVPPWKEGAFIGWLLPQDKSSAEQLKLKTFLLENFKSETGDETPEACAIRLLSKLKKK